MFPTAGYFRSTNCPFFVHGLCHRPYCHFRHSKPGLKNSKSKISPHKHKTEEHGNVGDCVQHVSKVTEVASDVKAVNSHQSRSEDKYKTTPTTAIKSILKKSNEETSKQSNLKDSSEDSSEQRATVDDSARPDSNSIETFDDIEQPFASLTDEEKQIIGLMSHPSSVSNNLSTYESLDAKINPVSNAISVTSFDDKASTSTNIENEAVVSSESAKTNLNDACKDVQVKEQAMKDASQTASLCSNEKEKMANEIVTDPCHDRMAEKHELTFIKEKFDTFSKDKSNLSTEEKSDKISRKRKSVQLNTTTKTKTLREGCIDDVPSSDVIFKKRKSQQLPCVTDAVSPDSLVKGSEDLRELKHLKANDGCIKQEATTLDKFFKSASKSFQQIEVSMKTSSRIKNSTPEDVAYVIPKKHKHVVDGAVTLNRKNPAKEVPVESTHGLKKTVKISDAELNFFGTTKKAPKSSKVEKQKDRKEKASPVKTSKGSKLELEAKGLDKCKELKQKFSKGVTILVSDDSDASGPARDSSSEEDNHLKRIWDEYEPQHDCAWVENSPVKSPVKELQKKKMLPAAAAVPLTAEEKQASLADTLGLGKKQRVAHSASHLPRRLTSNANPIRRYPKMLSAVQKKQEPSASSASVESPINTAATSYKPVKQRVAHVAKRSAPAGSLPRPRIPVEYGAKVPQNQRQRYLDRIIDECLRIYPTEKEAFEKAVEEEQALYERSTRRQVYLNLCVNAIKKLREMKPQEIPTTSPVKTETVTRVAVTKTLPSGAVLISTKSPVKQDQPVRPASDELTEEVMYDFLSKYLMSEEDLVENGYPRPCPTSPGKAVIKTNKEQPSKDSSRRICRRCGKPFVVLEDGEYLTREECVYHAGRLFRRRGEQSYSCCQGDAGTPGCCVGKVHVSDDTGNTDGFMTTIVSPLADQRKKIFAMDCEMCYTTAGLELTRITVVNWNLEGVYDTFVIPERPIVDYNTRFSGVTEELLRGVTTTIREVQAVLLSMIHKDTILVGHSLESDLKATKLIHSKVVDTSIVFPHRLGRPYKRALRNLMADYLKKIIQDSVEGHDSHEDARACLELMRWKVKEDMKRTSRHKSPRLSLG